MTEAQQDYFDLHITGIGYLSRFRKVTSKEKGKRHEPFHCVAISALEGPTNEPNYSYFDCRVAGAKALETLQLLEIAQAINDPDARVLAGFKLGGVAPDIYQVRSGAHAGETRVSLKTRLIRIRWVRIRHKNAAEYRLAYQDDEQDSVPAPSTATDDQRLPHAA
jgi:hypothetical protein